MHHKNILLSVVCTAAFGASSLFGAATLSKADMQFMKMAAEANMTQAHLGQMAESQASQQGVKDFGQTLDKDHTNAYEGLTMLASKTGESVPKGIDIRRNKAIEQLMHAKGKSFDHAFLQNEIQSQQRVIAEFKTEAAKGENADVKAWANTVLPTLEGHLQTAKTLAKDVKPAK